MDIYTTHIPDFGFSSELTNRLDFFHSTAKTVQSTLLMIRSNLIGGPVFILQLSHPCIVTCDCCPVTSDNPDSLIDENRDSYPLMERDFSCFAYDNNYFFPLVHAQR